MKDLYAEKYKPMLIEIKDLNKWKDTVFMDWKLITVKMTNNVLIQNLIQNHCNRDSEALA